MVYSPPIKPRKQADWMNTHGPTICRLKMTHLIDKDSHRMDVKGWDTIFQADRGQEQGVTSLGILDRTQQISSQNCFKPF